MSRLGSNTTDIARLSAMEVFDGLEESGSVQHIYQQLRRLNEIIAEESTTRSLWQDVRFAVFHVTPILHDCLSVARASPGDDIALCQRECFRLASILYLIEVRAKFDFEAGAGMLYGSKLQAMLGRPGLLTAWDRSNHFLLWILTVASCAATLFHDSRAQFVRWLSDSLRATDISSFDKFSTLVNGFVWSETAFGPALLALADQIDFP